MKTAALFISLAATGLLHAEEPVVIEPLGLAGREHPAPAAAVVGGETVRYDLVVDAAVPGTFSPCADIRQAAKDLMAPLKTNVALGPEISFPTAGRRTVAVEIPIPEVQKGTLMVVDFKTAPDRPAIAQAGFVVFPKMKPGAQAEAVEGASKSGGLRLAVFGESVSLREFLKKEGITFEDLGVEFPKEFRSGLLILGEVTAGAVETHRPDGRAGRAILFVSGTRLLPGVYEAASPSGSLTKVTLPLMRDLSANPQNQSVFLDLILHQLNPAESASTL
jgi:hypothetical protein